MLKSGFRSPLRNGHLRASATGFVLGNKYWLAWRRSEIAIRMALGAEQARVLRMVLGEAAILIVAGLALGLGIAVFSTHPSGTIKTIRDAGNLSRLCCINSAERSSLLRS